MEKFDAQKTEVITEIKTEFHRENILYKKASFQCFADGVFTYHYKLKCGGYWQICIISEDTTFFDKEKIIDLIENKNIFFLDCAFYGYIDKAEHKIKGTHEFFARKTFSIVDYITIEDYNEMIGKS